MGNRYSRKVFHTGVPTLAIDFSLGGLASLPVVLPGLPLYTPDMAKSTNSELHVAYVFPTAVQRPFPNPITSRPREMLEHELEEAMQQAQHFLDQQVERVKEEGVSVAEAHLIRGEPDKEVVHLSEEIGAGLIIMGSRGLGGIRRALMG